MKKNFQSEIQGNNCLSIAMIIIAILTIAVDLNANSIDSTNSRLFGVIGLALIISVIGLNFFSPSGIFKSQMTISEYEDWVSKNKTNYKKYEDSSIKCKEFDFSYFLSNNCKSVNKFYIYENGTIVVISDNNENKFNINDIVKFEVEVEPNPNQINTSLSSVKGAAVGGLLFGGAGAIVGALIGIGNTTKSPTIKIMLKLLLKNFSDNTIQVEIFSKFHTSDYTYAVELIERKKLLSDLISLLEVVEKNNIEVKKVESKPTTENTMELKNVDLIKKYIDTNDLEYKIEIKRRGITEEMIDEVKKSL